MKTYKEIREILIERLEEKATGDGKTLNYLEAEYEDGLIGYTAKANTRLTIGETPDDDLTPGTQDVSVEIFNLKIEVYEHD